MDILKAALPKTWKDALISVYVCDDVTGDGVCSNKSNYNVLMLGPTTFAANHVPRSIKLDIWTGRSMTLASNSNVCEKQYSPLLLDLTGEGFKLTGPGRGVRFDLNDTGTPVLTGWVAPNTYNAFLVRLLNHNGRIESGAQMFGSATRLKNGSRAANGFEALAELDSNHDGYLTSDDAEWGRLLLWLDRDADGVSDRGELFTLRQGGVKSISLKYVDLNEVDLYGNQTRERSTFRRQVARGSSVPLLIIDVWFNTLVDF